jgi:hypothetical protein
MSGPTQSFKMIERRDLGLDDGGWVKIHHSIFQSWVAERPDWMNAWVTLIAMAQWKPKRVYVFGQIHDLKRGQLTHSQRYLAQRFGMTHKCLRHFLKLLEGDSMIERHRKGPGQDIITICNYSEYQGEGHSEDSARGTGRAQVGHSRGTIYKDKIKEDTKNTLYREPDRPHFNGKGFVVSDVADVVIAPEHVERWRSKFPRVDLECALPAMAVNFMGSSTAFQRFRQMPELWFEPLLAKENGRQQPKSQQRSVAERF